MQQFLSKFTNHAFRPSFSLLHLLSKYFSKNTYYHAIIFGHVEKKSVLCRLKTIETDMSKEIQIETKEQSDRHEVYQSLIPQLESLIAGESNLVGVLANVTATLRTAFGERFFWVGFYIVEGENLLLGPFQGTVACFSIGRGRGVCGSAWVREETVIVDDVEQFPGHIACSSLSRSEIVVPVKGSNGEVVAVLDIDSTELKSFDDTDREGLEIICAMLGHLFH